MTERSEGKMVKEEMAGIVENCGTLSGNAFKLETALAWIRCAQRGKSPIDRLREKNIERIIVYGITELGELLVEEACRKKYKVLAIADRAVQEGGYEYRGIPVIARKQLEKYSNEVIVVTSMTFWEEIRDELYAEGCRCVIALREIM